MSIKQHETLYFIGGLFPHEREGEIRKLTKSGLQSAANNLQWKFLKGYDACLGAKNVHIINSEYIGSFPLRYGGLRIPRYLFAHSKGAMDDVGAGFINLPVIKELSRARRIISEIDRIPRIEGEQLYFVGYAATYPIVMALQHAKERFKSSVCCLIVPDLPQYMELGKNGAGILRKIKNEIVNNKMKKMDCYIPLTAAMAPYLGTDLEHCCVVEGIADDEGVESASTVRFKLPERYILYTGTLQYRYGIGDLISAFRQIDDDSIDLVICGDGEAADEIKALKREDKRIIYLGVLSVDAVAFLRKHAHILINPRKNEGSYTKFSFPSKMMEYLATGVPTVAYKLDGMPEDYDGLYFDATEDGLKATIKRVLSMGSEESSSFAERARKYVLEEKSPKRQCERTLALLRRETMRNG
ncbi:glycosyltransferase family 4 protein [Olsenella uli]|uniref:glycosyltransferase family 4 protein n=1 Tax=Olsenella uli TaxID=133926 RepID=UPI00195A240E|nr:glycosyltransferase family 4 protein [Olsenella uli]MBM6816666.1 glycosyltransferase family 4 protein [Olsenella uli]